MKWKVWMGWALLVPTMMLAQTTKLAPELKLTASEQSIPVIVQYKPAVSASKVKIVAGVSAAAQLTVINGVRVVVPASALASLAADPNVAYVSPDRPVRGLLNNSAPAVLANYAWGLGLDGTHVGVAVIDSGIHDSHDLSQTGGSRIK
ncbi:MAG TPA: hypothetical protein VMU45_01060, partial [Candidatus Eisenbacteria bacterium]|nr:hypothetical protein [Candidatus Eisenbacteria bacterium]